MRNIKGLTFFELIISATLIGIFVSVFLFFIGRQIKIAKEIVLAIELKGLRQSLVLYKAIKSEPAPDLRALITARHKPQGLDEVIFGREYLNTLGIDQEGYPVDPFGKRFYYSPRRGVVSSQAKGYESW